MKFIIPLLFLLSLSCFAYDFASSLCYLVTPEKLFVSDCFTTTHEGEDPNSAEMQAMRMCISWALRISAHQSVILDYDRLTYFDDPEYCLQVRNQAVEGLLLLQDVNIADISSQIFAR